MLPLAPRLCHPVPKDLSIFDHHQHCAGDVRGFYLFGERCVQEGRQFLWSGWLLSVGDHGHTLGRGAYIYVLSMLGSFSILTVLAV